jgi:ADP-ribose pyrophosphatase YjhB (NUDIX family)
MSASQCYATSVDGKRQFACFPAVILVFIVDKQERVLLLSHPRRQGMWEVVNGVLEVGENVLEGALRETSEEIGPEVHVRPLGTVHVSTFHYDANVRCLITISYLMAYEGGEIRPGGDMRNSQFRWWNLAELANESVELLIPPKQKWLAERAVELYRLWKDRTFDLQPELDPATVQRYSTTKMTRE